MKCRSRGKSFASMAGREAQSERQAEMMDINKVLCDHLDYTAAIESAWRWFRRNKDPIITLSAVVERIQAKYPNVDRMEIQREFEMRMSRTRARTDAPRT